MPLYLKDKLVSGTGAPGKSAYQAAVDAGYVGTEAAFNQALTSVPGHIADTNNPHNVTATQVDAYSKAESDTLLQNKAPAGFGFGEVLTAVQVTSSTETYEQFCEKVDAVLATMPNGTAMLVNAYPPEKYGYANADISILYKYNSNYALLKSIGSSDRALNGWRMVKSKKDSSDVSGTWDPFEWDNPPMQLGEIYRTIERYNTQPIYKKIDSNGIRWWSLDQVNWKVEAEGSGSYTRTEADTLLNKKQSSISAIGVLKGNGNGEVVSAVAGKDYVDFLVSDVSLYVSTSGNDNNDGTQERPFKTIQHAINILPKNLNGKSVIIKLAPGTYEENVSIVGFYGAGSISLFGADTRDSATGATIKPTSGNALSIMGCFINVFILYFVEIYGTGNYGLLIQDGNPVVKVSGRWASDTDTTVRTKFSGSDVAIRVDSGILNLHYGTYHANVILDGARSSSNAYYGIINMGGIVNVGGYITFQNFSIACVNASGGMTNFLGSDYITKLSSLPYASYQAGIITVGQNVNPG